MGSSKDNGYVKQSLLTGTGENTLEALLKNALQGLQQQGDITQNPIYQQSLQGLQSFLPGGQGFAPIQAQAQQNFQQQTIPSILNAFGQGSKGGSALNQALAGAGQNLNTNLASQLAQMQLQASQAGVGAAQVPFQQALQGAQLGLGTTPFAYQQKQTPFWQQALMGGIGLAGQLGGAALGNPLAFLPKPAAAAAGGGQSPIF